VKKTFGVLNEMVSDRAIENYAITGAIGAIFYIEPFATQDINVLIVMPKAEGGLVAEMPGWRYLRGHSYSEMEGPVARIVK